MKTLRFSFVFAGFMLYSFNTHAQSFALGIRAGFSIPNLTDPCG